MRALTFAAAAASSLFVATSAFACPPGLTECLPRAVSFPAYTPEGVRIGTVQAQVRQPIVLQASRFTGQPITVIYNNPDRDLGVVDGDAELVPLPRVARSRTVGAYPVGY